MKQPQAVSSLEERIGCLERRLRIWRVFGGLSLLVVVFAACAAIFLRPANADGPAKVLRVRGLVIEDAQGRPRILLGAPIPKVSGRKRQGDDTGIVLVGENRADRVAIGAPTPAPQSKGKILQRISPAVGLVVDDLDENERGGMGILDNGRGAICLDYPDPIGRDAICLGVMPEIGLAGLMINAPTGDNGERAEMAVLKNGTSLIKLADPNGDERTMLLVPGDSPAQFLVIDPKTRSKVDVLEKFKP